VTRPALPVDGTVNPWRPIETAPKDETEVLLYFPNGYWATGENMVTGFWGGEPEEPAWYFSESDSKPMTAFGSCPTHWMPLPRPPE
jgi:hypothetical protein